LKLASGETFQPLQDGEQVPASVRRCKGVQLVDDDGAHGREEQLAVDPPGHQHRFDRLGRGEQNVRALGEDPAAFACPDVAVPQPYSPAQPGPVRLEARVQVVQQCTQRRHVQDGGAGPALVDHFREQRKHRGLGLAACCRRDEHAVVAGPDGLDCRGLKRSKAGPAQ
jgi:hypothetical protein